jgi:hypothetical protein
LSYGAVNLRGRYYTAKEMTVNNLIRLSVEFVQGGQAAIRNFKQCKS